MKTSAVIALASTGLVASAAWGQTPCASPPENCATNPSFEIGDFGNPNAIEPQGWHNHSDPQDCIWRRNDDGRLPAVTARTGERFLQVTAPSPSGFRSFSTDKRNFFAPGFPFYDIAIDFVNGGDIVVEAYFMVPESDPITGPGFAAMKLNMKGAADPNQDNISLDPFSNEGPETFRITGHTCGQWVLYRAVWPIATARQQIQSFMVGTPPDQRPYDPMFDGVPNRLKIVLAHFHNNEPASGAVFWDDVRMVQLAPGEVPPPPTPLNGDPLCPPSCLADYNGDGNVDPDDLADYISCYFTMPPCDRADVNGDSNADPDDLADFIALFFQGC
ncbi:MAG: hypothetical protein JNK35_12130 [Phycisphaerae bacterium]|nr:hypothetical protein [Phycisphaerae bacterium]